MSIVAMTDAELQEAIDVIEAVGGHDDLLVKLKEMQGVIVCTTITKSLRHEAWRREQLSHPDYEQFAEQQLQNRLRLGGTK